MKSSLIVNTSKVVRMVARMLLEGLNSQTDEVEDGQKALEACQRNMPDVVLLDCNIPVKNIIECLGVLRAMSGVDQTVVVLWTIESNMTHIQEAIGGGADRYIMKLFDSDIIRSKFSHLGLI